MRVYHQKSAKHGKEYFSASDYYESGPEELKGVWFGEGATKLGLGGFVAQEQFDRMVDNQHPFKDETLTQRNLTGRRVFTDITFSSPKSVSILLGTTGDARIITAFQQSALETFSDLEKDVQTRVNHKRGEMTLENTNNLAGAFWVHLTDRPEDHPEFGVHPDMQLHGHGAILNVTHDDSGRRTAIDLSNVVRDSGYYNALFMSRLATKIKHLGYEVQRSEHNFEISGISRDTIEKFSRRSTSIKKLVDQGVAHKIASLEGISLEDAKDSIGARTRQLKQKSKYSTEELPDIWRKRLSDKEVAQINAIATGQIPAKSVNVTPKDAVDYSIEHCFVNESVVRERQVIRHALSRGHGDVTVDQVMDEFNRRSWIREGEGSDALITTREILKEEQALLAFTRRGRGKARPLATDHVIEREWLSDEQKEAVHGLLCSRDRLQILRGVAGVGKTTVMQEAIAGIEKKSTKVTVLAPTGTAAHETLKEAGFENPNTLASFLTHKRNQVAAKGGVIWVDEAGQAGMQDISNLAKIAKQIDARIILSGDRRQHKSVARGAPLRLLENQAGVKPHEIVEIRRQDGDYREAVMCLSRGEVLDGFNRLNDLGFVHQIRGDKERYQQLANDYADSIEGGTKTLVIAPTHAERQLVTQAIRQEMKARGHIHNDDHAVETLKSKRLTSAERGDGVNYEKGDVIEFIRRGKGGFKAGDRMQVIEVNGDQVIASSSNGVMEVPIDKPASFNVYRWMDSSFAVGDTLRITKTDTKNEIFNGNLVTLESFSNDGSLQLSNGKTIKSDWGHIENGVTITSHSSQGKSYPRVLVAQSSLSFPASSDQQIYVSASRGIERVDFYTNSTSGLRDAIRQSRPDLMASELNPQKNYAEMASRLVDSIKMIHRKVHQLAKNQLLQFQNELLNSPQQAQERSL